MYLGYTVEYEDLVSYGIFGLIDAIDKFDYRKGIKFETYASLRIRGAILDQIRKMDWIPRSVRQKQRQIDAAITKLESTEDKTATDEELVEQGIEVRAFDNQKYADNEPEKVYEKEELKNLLKESLDKLTEKERMVVVLYYYE